MNPYLFSYFSYDQIIPLIIGVLFLVTSIFIFKSNSTLSMILLLIGSFFTGLFISLLDPFLILWDEQIHALVAKNMIDYPFKPMIYTNPIFDYDYKNWTANHVWLHKQPLFLWQMALSIKCFGFNELAVRLPSIVMHSVLSFFIYRIGKIILNKNTAYVAAIFIVVAFFPLELVAGRYSTDHNDIAFLFYVTASFWALIEYLNSNNKKWIYLIGLFSGCAVLNKWLMGTLPIFSWLLTIIISDENRFKIKTYKEFFFSCIICLTVFLPWQLYILNQFPVEALNVYKETAEHFNKQYHIPQNTFYYFTKGFDVLYGAGVVMPIVVIVGLFFMFKNIQKPIYKSVILVSIIFVYIFYSIAKTKMPAFTIIVMPFVILAIAHLCTVVVEYIKWKRIREIVRVIVILLIAYGLFNPARIVSNHTMWKPHDNHERVRQLEVRRTITSINDFLGDERHIVFNYNIIEFGYIPFMFYTNHEAYQFVPTPQQLLIARKKNKKIAIIESEPLPDYIKKDTLIRIIFLADL